MASHDRIPTRTEGPATANSLPRFAMMLVVFAGVTSIVLVVAVLGYLSSDDASYRDLWLELARTALGLLAVGVAGGFITFEWNDLASRREQVRAEHARTTARAVEARRRRLDRIDAEHNAIVGLYNDVKAIRRALRALGLDSRRVGVAGSETLAAEQIEGFRYWMRELSRVQLGFEAKKREFEQLCSSGRATSEQATILRDVEKWLNKVVDVWEEKSASLRDGMAATTITDGLDALIRSSSLKANVTEPLEQLLRSLYDALLEGEPTGERE